MSTNPESELNWPQGTLERALITEYLAKRGYTLHSVNSLPGGDRESLLRGAAAFAALRLAEIEARAHFLDEIA
jgi:hypothetical protein